MALGNDALDHNLVYKVLVNNHKDVVLLGADVAGSGPVRNDALVAEATAGLIEEAGVGLVDAADGQGALIVVSGENRAAVVDRLGVEQHGAQLLAHRDAVAHLRAHAAAVDDAVVRDVREALEHLLVAAVATGAQVDGLGVYLDDLADAALTLDAGHTALVVGEQLVGAAVEEELHAQAQRVVIHGVDCGLAAVSAVLVLLVLEAPLLEDNALIVAGPVDDLLGVIGKTASNDGVAGKAVVVDEVAVQLVGAALGDLAAVLDITGVAAHAVLGVDVHEDSAEAELSRVDGGAEARSARTGDNEVAVVSLGRFDVGGAHVERLLDSEGRSGKASNGGAEGGRTSEYLATRDINAHG